MKKTLSMLLAVCMLCALCVPAFAANITETGAQTQDTVVKYGMEASYTVTIPETVAIDVDTLQGNTTVKASDVVLASGEKLNIVLTGDCNENKEFHLKDTTDASNTLAYTISNADGDVLTTDDVVMTVDAGNVAGASAALKFALTSDVTKAGTYTDTLTFEVEIEAETPVVPSNPTTICDNCQQERDADAFCEYCGNCELLCCTCCEDCINGVDLCENGLCPEHCAKECYHPAPDEPTRPCEGCGKALTRAEQCGECGCYCEDCCTC